jgi:hypothetical protein
MGAARSSALGASIGSGFNPAGPVVQQPTSGSIGGIGSGPGASGAIVLQGGVDTTPLEERKTQDLLGVKNPTDVGSAPFSNIFEDQKPGSPYQLIQGKWLQAPFNFSGLYSLPIADKWGNEILLAMAIDDGSKDGAQLYDPDMLIKPVLGDSTSRRQAATIVTPLRMAVLARMEEWAQKNMAAQGWTHVPQFESEFRHPEGGPVQYDDGTHDFLNTDPRFSGFYETINPVDGFTPHWGGVAASFGGWTTLQPDSQKAFFGNPWIDGVPVKLPVAPEDADAFGGWVLCRVHKFLRIAVITELYYGGWGDETIWAAKIGDAAVQLGVAVLKTIAGVVLIVVGAVISIYGGAGVPLIGLGIALIVSAWYDFNKYLKRYQDAIKANVSDPNSDAAKKAKAFTNKFGPKGNGPDSSSSSTSLFGLLIIGGIVAIKAL